MNKEENPTDSVHLEIPLLIRLFEYSREDATSDQDLHVVAENLLKCAQEMEGKPLSMACYDKVVPTKEESTVAGDIALKDVSLFRGKDKMQKVKNPVMESVSLKESIRRVISQG